MATSAMADEYFMVEDRIASFETAQPLPKKRASNASSKSSKTIKWPHKFLTPFEMAKAGFFYHPLQNSPDNACCFLCRKSIDEWEEGDDPIEEHLKHSPDCGWAVTATISGALDPLSKEYPLSARMAVARRATFANKWPHEGKKGWKCQIKQMADAGWKYTPIPEADDMATCDYCDLGLDGWEPSDKPLEEHFKRSADCPFFTLINEHKETAKGTKSKRGRTSKASRLSTQSAFRAASEAPSVSDLAAEEGDSILTTATNATATRAKNMGKGKTAAKARKTRAKKDEPIEVVATEPKNDDFEVKADPAPKSKRGRKRKSDENPEEAVIELPQPKRRATRTRGSVAADESIISHTEEPRPAPKKKATKKGRASTRSTRKTSQASVITIDEHIPDDAEIDRALEADLEARMSEDEAEQIIQSKKSTRGTKIAKSDHSMFDPEPIQIDEKEIEAELEAMEVDSKPLPKAKGAKGKTTRKVSAKQQAAAKRAAQKAEAAEAERQAESAQLAEAERQAAEEAAQQMAAELEHSVSMQYSSPAIQPKKQRASSRQPTRKALGRRVPRGSVMSEIDQDVQIPDSHESHNDDSGHETDASIASQSTVIRGGSNRGGKAKKGKGYKVMATNIEDIVQHSLGTEPHPEPVPSIETDQMTPVAKGKGLLEIENVSMAEEAFFTPRHEVPEPVLEPTPEPVIEKPVHKVAKKAVKSKGRPAKHAQAVSPQPSHSGMDYVIAEDAPLQRENTPIITKSKSPAPPRSLTPAPKETTPSQSPQSSDAENHPPSSKPSAITKKVTVATPRFTKRVPLAAATPIMSPSKRNVIAGLQTSYPWTAVDLDSVFLRSPGGENLIKNSTDLFGSAMDKVKNGELTSPEKQMTVEEWIKYNAEKAEEKLRNECERMVGAFEREGTRAMRALEGVECLE